MKKTVFLLFSLFVILALVACAPQEKKDIAYKAPAGLELPLELKLTSSEAWRETDEGFALVKERAGIIEYPAWWTGNRPPQGEMVVLEIDYRDDVSVPVRAEIYSGMGSGERFSELHRFGGLCDSSWNTARIPCPWDLTLLHLSAGTIRFRLISSDADLAVRRLRLVEPRADDERRYNSETRAWVSRVQQARAQIDSNYYKLAQRPIISGNWAQNPLVPYRRNWMDLILPISAPQAGETDFPISVRMAANEYEPVQIGIYANGEKLSGVEVTMDPIRGSNGTEVATCCVRVAEYSLVKSQLESYEVEPFPQRLWPVYPFDVPAGRSHLVWIELKTLEKNAQTGTFSTTIRIRASGLEEISIPLNVEILPCRMLTMDEADLKLGGHTIGLVPEHDLAFQREYNHNMVDLWYGGIHPALSIEGDSFSMDFRIMDDWMESARRQGFTDVYYFLGGNPYGFPMTMDMERDLAKSVLGMDDEAFRAMVMENPDSVHPEIAPLIVEWTRRISEHARAHNWLRLVLTPFDEPAKWIQTHRKIGDLPLALIKPHFIHWAQLLREGDPQATIAADIHHYNGGMDFVPYLDIVCTNATHENLDMPDEVRSAGKVFWEFGGTNDRGTPNQARYILGFYYAAHDSRAAQIWAYNWGERFDTLEGNNWLYAWYTPFDVIPHPYMEGVREGMDERRLLETLKREADEKNVDISAFLNSLFEEVASMESRLRGRKVTEENFWARARDAEVMDSWHERMVEKLLSLQ